MDRQSMKSSMIGALSSVKNTYKDFKPDKNSICFGFARRDHLTNSRVSYVTDVQHPPTRAQLSTTSTSVRPTLDPHSLSTPFATLTDQDRFSTTSIASSHYQPYARHHLHSSSSTGAIRSPTSVDKQRVKNELQRSNLPWKEPPTFFTFGRATPEDFAFRGLPCQKASQKDTRNKMRAVNLSLGSDKAAYSSSASVSRHFKEARAEFGDRKFFPHGSQRQRGIFHRRETSEVKDTSALVDGDTTRKTTGLVLGYAEDDYKCTNSMSRFYERRQQEHIEDARPAKPITHGNKVSVVLG